ncbi:hypothetical protein MHI49_09390 [Bacillus sp. FSL M7-0884]|nr:hypothetical protein [Bacillus wiedmannii]EJS66233.1 hypothetical protein ICW_03939 [Bacillus wiedmannii]
MFSVIKKWFWYDWIFVTVRTFWLFVIISADFIYPSLINASFVGLK